MSTHQRRLQPALVPFLRGRILAVALAALLLVLTPAGTAPAEALGPAKTVRVMKVAAKQKGTPYRYGGTTPRGFDCSGYTRYVYRKAGKWLPRTSKAQRRYSKRVARPRARRGDLVFFHRGRKRVARTTYHVGIYAGRNRVWHAPSTGSRVKRQRIWTRKVSFGRVR